MAADYIPLITNAHADKPRFVALVDLLTRGAGEIGDVAASLPSVFDVDSAVGAQLDAVGLWVGISRTQRVPIAGAFFTWDDAALGWNRANWKGPYEPTEGIVVLDDRSYRAVIKAKISSNYWLGNNAGAQDYEVTRIDGVYYFVIDNMDMTVTAHLVGQVSAALKILVTRGDIGFKTAGVRLAGVTVTFGPLFALDSSGTPYFGGLDVGVLS